jgi:hypothetical protein
VCGFVRAWGLAPSGKSVVENFRPTIIGSRNANEEPVMSGYEADIREALKWEFESGALKDIGSSDGVFELIAKAYPLSGSKIDWSNVRGALTCVEDVDSRRSERFIEFFDDICARFGLTGPVLYVGDSATGFALAGSIPAIRCALPVLIDVPQHHFFIGPNASWCFCFTMEGDIDFGTSSAPPFN